MSLHAVKLANQQHPPANSDWIDPMPMLPSGRHVAILLQPLNALLHDAHNVVNVHKVLAIQHKKDVYPFTEVLWLVPQAEATKEQVDDAFLDGSLPRPPGLVPVRSGYRLSQFEQFAAEWSVEDRKAFWDFILVRADFVFDEAMAKSVLGQNFLRTQAGDLTMLMVAWWDAGIHPAQDGYAVAEGDLSQYRPPDALKQTEVRSCQHGGAPGRRRSLRRGPIWSPVPVAWPR